MKVFGVVAERSACWSELGNDFFSEEDQSASLQLAIDAIDMNMDPEIIDPARPAMVVYVQRLMDSVLFQHQISQNYPLKANIIVINNGEQSLRRVSSATNLIGTRHLVTLDHTRLSQIKLSHDMQVCVALGRYYGIVIKARETTADISDKLRELDQDLWETSRFVAKHKGFVITLLSILSILC